MSVKLTSHVREVKRNMEQNMKRAATIIGGMAEGYAKGYAPVDTGLLRNSITYALGGESPEHLDYKSNDENERGSYDSSAPQDAEGQITVYIGTNVQYAPYQELGAPNVNVPAHPFLRPAIENHISEYQEVLKRELSRG